MHDHVINFKADMDVVGPNNTLMKVTVEPRAQLFPWSEGVTLPTMGLSRTPIEVECGLNWTANSQSMYIVLDTESKNSWGEDAWLPDHVRVGDGDSRAPDIQWIEKFGKSGILGVE